jgi:hypothetical protein
MYKYYYYNYYRYQLLFRSSALNCQTLFYITSYARCDTRRDGKPIWLVVVINLYDHHFVLIGVLQSWKLKKIVLRWTLHHSACFRPSNPSAAKSVPAYVKKTASLQASPSENIFSNKEPLTCLQQSVTINAKRLKAFTGIEVHELNKHQHMHNFI